MDATVVDHILRASPDQRRSMFARMTWDERVSLEHLFRQEIQNPWRRFENDPVGFVTEGLQETLWTKQREILESVRENKRTAVPACHAPGKSHIAARAVAWWVTVHPPSTVQVVTTATTFRQVRNVLWPHIRRVAQRHNLPGDVYTVDWKIDNEMVAFGFSAQNHDETAVQGMHAPHLLVVVDEAGGISDTLGNALEALMTGGHTRLLILGNPPTDNEASWFERACSSPLYNVIPIDAYSTPNFTGEDAGICRACPPEVKEHSVAEHLVDETWVDDVVREFGEESPFVIARVHARFPRSLANKVIPIDWLEEAVTNPNPATDRRIRLGVDIASDGGDEFVIAWADGFSVTIVHKQAGSANQNAVDVAGKILEWIHKAQAHHVEHTVKGTVRVKIDAIGLGWGVVSLLEKWGQEGRHEAEIVGVNVGERAGSATKYANQRAEMWWNGRMLVQPVKNSEGVLEQQMALPGADRQILAQLSGPMYKTDSSGRIVIEKKSDMKKRGVSSPDQAEAILLAVFEPPGKAAPPMVAPIGLAQENPWHM